MRDVSTGGSEVPIRISFVLFEQDTEPLIGRNRKCCRGNNHS
jgi:hypothetical protein